MLLAAQLCVVYVFPPSQAHAKKLRVAINGFGRIGRNFLRCQIGRPSSNLEVVVVNDSGGVKQASHLLKYDSILGTFDADVKKVRLHVTRRSAACCWMLQWYNCVVL